MPKRILDGVVIKDSIDKTAVVMVETKKQHKRYKKMLKSKKIYLAHDEDNSTKVGTLVKIEEHVPFSKRKKWIVLK